MITIHQPEIMQINGKSRLIAEIDIDGEKKPIWFEVDAEYGKYLCFERSDAFLIGVLKYAMVKKHDIVCVAPVTEELFYNLNKHLIPILVKYGADCHRVRIIAPTSSEELENYGGVGTAMSGGVDSFHAALTHWSESPTRESTLTHLFISNIGNFHTKSYKDYGMERIKKDVYERARRIAHDMGLPLIESDSNIVDIIRIRWQFAYAITFAVYCMQKLWKTYS